MTSDGPNIKRVSSDHGLESITLRSDVAARYIFLNEALLSATGFIKQDNLDKWRLSLKEVLVDEKIKDETRYLEKWVSELEKEIVTIKKEEIHNPEEFKDMAYLENAVKLLEKEFLNPQDHELRASNNTILKDYCKKFNRSIYEVSGGMSLPEDNYENESGDEKASEEETSSDTNNDEGDDDNGSNEIGLGTTYYRIQKRLRIKGVEYEKGTYKRRHIENKPATEDDKVSNEKEEESKNEEVEESKNEEKEETIRAEKEEPKHDEIAENNVKETEETQPLKQTQASSPATEEDPDSTQVLSSTPQTLQ